MKHINIHRCSNVICGIALYVALTASATGDECSSFTQAVLKACSEEQVLGCNIGDVIPCSTTSTYNCSLVGQRSTLIVKGSHDTWRVRYDTPNEGTSMTGLTPDNSRRTEETPNSACRASFTCLNGTWFQDEDEDGYRVYRCKQKQTNGAPSAAR